MVFSSLLFLFVFLPVFLCVYYAAQKSVRSPIIFCASLIFYAWWRIDFALLFVAVILLNYGLALMILQCTKNAATRVMIVGIVINLCILGVFKYLDFGIASFNAALGFNWSLTGIILPIGISFYIFHCISFLVDIKRRTCEAPRSFWDFAAFTSMFPHLVAGPVLKYQDMAAQFADFNPSRTQFNQGCVRFMSGFCQKVLIADSIAPLADAAFDLPAPTMGESWLGALAYALQLYFDFAGYSAMAVGLAQMMGFRFIENFNHPYMARSVSDFWQRWHISLSSWLREYVYFPLGGNRHGLVRTCTNIFLVMILCGMWHGANATFLLWGAYHGAAMVAERMSKWTPPSWLSIPATFIFVVAGWVLFRAVDVTHAMDMYRAMIDVSRLGISDNMAWQISGLAVTALAAALTLVIAVPVFEKTAQVSFRTWHPVWYQSVLLVLFIVAIVKLTASHYTPFLYFQF